MDSNLAALLAMLSVFGFGLYSVFKNEESEYITDSETLTSEVGNFTDTSGFFLSKKARGKMTRKLGRKLGANLYRM